MKIGTNFLSKKLENFNFLSLQIHIWEVNSEEEKKNSNFSNYKQSNVRNLFTI